MIDDLLFDGERRVLILFQNLRQPLAAGQLRQRDLIEIRTELSKCGKLAELRQSSRSEPATCRMALICALPPTRETEIPTFTAGRTPELKRSLSRNIWPSVIEMTFVGMYAETSPACVSMIGSAVSEPLPFSSFSFAARSSKREWR